MILATTALRISEVAGLQVGDVDLPHGLLTVRRQTYPGRGGLVTKETKGRRRRPVPIIEPLRATPERLTAWTRAGDCCRCTRSQECGNSGTDRAGFLARDLRSMAENESGERAFKVDGNAVQLRETFVLRDAAGPEVAEIQERKVSVRDSMKSSAPPGTRPFTRHWSVCGIVSRSMWTAAPT